RGEQRLVGVAEGGVGEEEVLLVAGPFGETLGSFALEDLFGACGDSWSDEIQRGVMSATEQYSAPCFRAQTSTSKEQSTAPWHPIATGDAWRYWWDCMRGRRQALGHNRISIDGNLRQK